jgi:hypothetical protein
MSIIDSVERKALFSLTRALAFLMITGLSVALVFGIVRFSSTLVPPTTRVQLSDVIPSQQKPESGSTEAEPVRQVNDNTSTLRMPISVQRHFSDEQSHELLVRWLERLKASQRQEFVDNLGEIISGAEAQNADVASAIDRYKDRKFELLQQYESERLESAVRRGAIVAALASGLMLIALFSLVLVLLAIERNTRRARQTSTVQTEVHA